MAELWAGPMSIATGLEYRHDSTSLQHGPLSNSFVYFQNFGADYNAEQDVAEGYLETDLPLARDLPLVIALNFNGAIRRTRYDISGFGGSNQAAASNKFNATTWKLGLIWEPLDWARFRFTSSRDIRAPNCNDPLLCPLITFGANQSQSEIRNVNVNLQWLRTSGLDIETAYKLPLSRISELPGTLTTRYIRGGELNATYYEPGQSPPVAGANSINDNHIGGVVHFNLNGSWDLGSKFGTLLFAQVNNLMDRAPPSAPQLQYPSNPVYFDLIGRSYKFGVRMKL